jgi:predicted alpha/beta-fold hydrolase
MTFIPKPFEPRRWFTNGHLQTIVGNFLPRADRLPPPEAVFVVVSPGTDTQIASQCLCHCHWQPAEVRAQRLTVILLHGLEGSSNSQYVVGNANKMFAAGMNVIRMNMRNCGGTERLSPTLYHSGLSGDVRAVMGFFLHRERLERIALVGYSMGGNLILKLAGELGPNAPLELRAAVGVSPAIDLGPSADLLHAPINRLYERRFLRALKRRFRIKTMLFPRAFDPAKADGLTSLRDFDDRITALYSGFKNADDYYFRAAAARVVDRIAIPTLILHACDDPFVVITPESRAKLAANVCITLLEPAHGGHCAFLAPPDPAHNDDGYWAETTLLAFLQTHAG